MGAPTIAAPNTGIKRAFPAPELPKTKAYLDELNFAFPKVETGILPVGTRVLVQIKRVREITAGGIIMPEESRDSDQLVMQVARVVALGPAAFCNRTSGAHWPEGAWAMPGDFVRIPRHQGDWYAADAGDGGPLVQHRIVDDLDITGVIVGDPLKVKHYV